MQGSIYGRLGRDYYSQKSRKAEDMNWIAKNGAIIAYDLKDIFILPYNNSVGSMFQIDF